MRIFQHLSDDPLVICPRFETNLSDKCKRRSRKYRFILDQFYRVCGGVLAWEYRQLEWDRTRMASHKYRSLHQTKWSVIIRIERNSSLIMRHSIFVVVAFLLLCATLLVSANPVQEQSRAISFPNLFPITNPFCAQLYCFVPCFCGSHLDSRGCSTCSCLPCNGGMWWSVFSSFRMNWTRNKLDHRKTSRASQITSNDLCRASASIRKWMCPSEQRSSLQYFSRNLSCHLRLWGKFTDSTSDNPGQNNQRFLLIGQRQRCRWNQSIEISWFHDSDASTDRWVFIADRWTSMMTVFA